MIISVDRISREVAASPYLKGPWQTTGFWRCLLTGALRKRRVYLKQTHEFMGWEYDYGR